MQQWTGAAATAILVALGVAGCASTTAARGPIVQPTRARAFVDTFDRILVAGFLADDMVDRGRVFDLNEETARLLRMTLRSRASLDVIETQPLNLRPTSAKGPSAHAKVLGDVPFWRRLGEEYREPLIVTGIVVFEPIGSQLEERTVGRRTIRVWRPAFRLELRLVFISGRTGEVLDSVSLGPATARSSHQRSSALALYFELMDRLRPSLLAVLGRDPGAVP